ncbi:alpha/beta hydrolase [Nocardia sp. NPDC055321]
MHSGKLFITAAATALAAVTGAVVVDRVVAAPPAAATEADLGRYYGQHPNWVGCGVQALDEVGAQCADITVPVNYAEPQGKTMTVAISRIAATDPAQRRGVMLSNPGGPGGSGLDQFIRLLPAMTPEVRAGYDLIGMDPRGVGRSTPIDCGWTTGFGLQSAGVDGTGFAESVVTQGRLAAECVANQGDRLASISTRNTARDMDVVRGVLGQERINYFGTSYGTYLGAVYMQMYPERSDRMVLDSAVDPERYGAVGMMQDMGPANEAALDRWADWAAARDGEYHFGATRAQVRATVESMIRGAAEKPLRIGEFDVDEHWLPMLLFTVLDDARNYPTTSAHVRLYLDAAAGKAVTPDPELAATIDRMLNGKPENMSAQMTIMCGDVGVPRDPSWYWRNIEAARATQPIFGAFANNITPCAFWPAPAEEPTTIGNALPALVIQATGDTRTTYANGVAMRKALTGSRLVTLENVDIHSVYGRYRNTCAWGAINTYFADGTLPATDITCRDDESGN